MNSYYTHNMSQRQEQKTKTRQQIVRSAVRFLKKKGIADVSVSDVMAEAGLTVGGFYAHFESKDALAEEAVHQGLQERRNLFLNHCDEKDWHERLQCALIGYFTRNHRDDEAGRCPMPMAAVDAARSETTPTAFVDELRKMAQAFECGRKSSAQRAPKEAVLGSLALMVGGMILARATKGSSLSDEILKASRIFSQAALSSMAADHSRRRSKKRQID
jgi:TetR/AcrR family transcriptional regulator, transcriptional repressor for nem operon